MRDGVIIDCGRQEAGAHPKEDDDWWLDLYVMLSRATKLDALLLIRAPELSFFAKRAAEDAAETINQFRSQNGRMQTESQKACRKAWP